LHEGLGGGRLERTTGREGKKNRGGALHFPPIAYRKKKEGEGGGSKRPEANRERGKMSFPHPLILFPLGAEASGRGKKGAKGKS